MNVNLYIVIMKEKLINGVFLLFIILKKRRIIAK